MIYFALPFLHSALGLALVSGSYMPWLMALIISSFFLFFSLIQASLKGHFYFFLFPLIALLLIFFVEFYNLIRFSNYSIGIIIALLISIIVSNILAYKICSYQNVSKVIYRSIFIYFCFVFLIYVFFNGFNLIEWYIPSSRFNISSLNITFCAGILSIIAAHNKNILIWIFALLIIFLLSKRVVLFAAIISSLFVIVPFMRKNLKLANLAVVISGCFAFLFFGSISEYVMQLSDIELGLKSLSRSDERSFVWNKTIEEYQLDYFFGLGSNYIDNYNFNGANLLLSNLHNTYLDIFISYGAIGFLFFLILVIFSIFNANNFEASLLIFLFIVAITESLIINLNLIGVITFTIIILPLYRKAHESEYINK